MSWSNFLYRTVKRLIPLDVTRIYLRAQEYHHELPSSADEIHCRLLGSDDLNRLSSDPDFSINPQFLKDAANPSVQTIGAILNDSVIAMCCFAQGKVPAHLNVGGTQFRGIGVHLPKNSSYLFKVYVKGEYRGKRLVAKMLQFALHSEDAGISQSVVTTTDISNIAFKNAAERLGFKNVGYAAEAVVLGHHLFKLPPPIYVENATQESVLPEAIVLKKPDLKSETV